MVLPILALPLIVWGGFVVITATTAIALSIRDKRKRRKMLRYYGSADWPPPNWPPPSNSEALTDSKSSKGRRPTPYPLNVPAPSDTESGSDSDESLFVMGDAIEGLPLSSTTGAAAHAGMELSRVPSLRRRSTSSFESAISVLSPKPLSASDNDAISLASSRKHTSLRRRLKRKVRLTVRFTQDRDVPDYRDILKKSRRSTGIGGSDTSMMGLLGSPTNIRSPAEIIIPLEEIAEDGKARRNE